MTGIDYSRLRHEAVRIARANLGYGESEGNNSGKFIRAMGGRDGDNWCALFAGYCYRRAYEETGYHNPGWMYRSGLHPELGAKALVKSLGKHSGTLYTLSDNVWRTPLVGDLVAWSRGMLPWQGHVGIVTESTREGFKYIAGNEGRDGVVKERLCSWDHPKLWKLASVQPSG